ncbi:winged helix-turn-helix domain-containing protein [Agromyces sp. LHK192]|uniref:winged helix-turn-helix domain-containing protein n=1 Tax=Agromyces sp. LHK192 TaxID=2498704 RepID=UPI000FD96685|nr:winged helix-turn-helix domain-containing protein [Agromyces sp. LHK192]
MSLAYAPARQNVVHPARPVSLAPQPTAVTATPVATRPAPSIQAAPTAPAAPRVRAVPEGTEARGFVLYVGIDEAKALEDGTSLHRIVEALRRLTAEIAPSSETYAAVALAPEGAGGRDVDVVRLALQDPAALAKQREQQHPGEDADRHPNGVIIDISRKRVLLDGEAAGLTYKEFELLQYLVLREGRTIDRHELIDNLWAAADDEIPSERTIDVHVRRLRSKLAHYQDIVRTVRGSGYRFDRHADVSIRQASTPSPDVF